MVPAGRFTAILAGVALVCLGLGLGAHAQREQYKGAQSDDNTVNLAGDPIALTGLVVAAGCLVLVLAVARPLPAPALPRPLRRRTQRPASVADALAWPLLAARSRLAHAGAMVSWRLRPALVGAIGAALALLAGTYLAVHMVQMAWPRVVGLTFEDGRHSPYAISVGLLASNARGIIPAAQGPLLALAAGAFLACGWALRHLWRDLRPARDAHGDSEALAGRHIAATALAAPFLAVAGWGAIAALVRLPADASATPFLLVLPLFALGAWGLLASMAVKAWHIVNAAREPARVPVAADAWHALGRIESAVAVALAALCLAARLLPNVSVPGLLEDGAPFKIETVNAFLQLQLFLAIPLLPVALVRRRAAAALREPVLHGAAPPHRLAWLVPGAVVASFLLAGIGTWLPERALWAWVLASLPLAVAAAAAGAAHATAAAVAVAAFALWSIGNTVYADYTPSTSALPEFDTPPGLLGLCRFLAAVLAAWGLARLARRAARGMRNSAAVPLAIGFGLGLAVVAFVELPLIAGPDPSTPGAIVVGSAVAASDGSVQVLFHVLAAIALLAAVLSLARILRPEWFGNTRPPPRPTTLIEPQAQAAR